jgi:hypothetical protein
MNDLTIDLTQDIQSLTTFRRRSADFLKPLRKSKRPWAARVSASRGSVKRTGFRKAWL